MTKLFEDMSLAKGDGRYLKMLTASAKTDVLVLNDYGLIPLNLEQRHEFLEILEDRHNLKSTLVTSQLPIEYWHEQIGDPTLADAILAPISHELFCFRLNCLIFNENTVGLKIQTVFSSIIKKTHPPGQRIFPQTLCCMPFAVAYYGCMTCALICEKLH